MNSENPYSAPIAIDSSVEKPKSERESTETLNAVARRTFWAWEKLRLIYNAILFAVTGLVCWLEPILISHEDFWLGLIPEAIVANLCFFCAPILESYVCWLGFRWSWLRPSLFILGTLLASVLALSVLHWQAMFLKM